MDICLKCHLFVYLFKFEVLANFLPSIKAQLETLMQYKIISQTLPLDPLNSFKLTLQVKWLHI